MVNARIYQSSGFYSNIYIEDSGKLEVLDRTGLPQQTRRGRLTNSTLLRRVQGESGHDGACGAMRGMR
jgi:hypothetical protein